MAPAAVVIRAARPALQGLEMDVVVIVAPGELWGDDEAAAPSLHVTLPPRVADPRDAAALVLHFRGLPTCALPLSSHLPPAAGMGMPAQRTRQEPAGSTTARTSTR